MGNKEVPDIRLYINTPVYNPVSQPHTKPLQTNPTKPPVPFNPPNSTRTPINSYSYSLNQIPHYSNSFTIHAPPTQTLSNSHHQDTISVGSTLL